MDTLPSSSADKYHEPTGSSDTTTSRRSLDDFSQRKRYNRPKTKRQLKSYSNRTVSLPTLPPDSLEHSSEDDISKTSPKKGKKSSRSLSLTSDCTLRGGETCAELLTKIKLPGKGRTRSRELDSSSDSSAGVSAEKGVQQGRGKTSKKMKVKKIYLVTRKCKFLKTRI